MFCIYVIIIELLASNGEGNQICNGFETDLKQCMETLNHNKNLYQR